MEQIVINITARDKTSSVVNTVKKALSGLESAAQKTVSKLSKMDAKVNLSAVDKASAVVDKAKSKVSGFTSKVWKATLSIVDMVTSPLQGIINMFKNPLFTAGAAIGVTLSIGNAINTYADFESTISKVSALSGTVGTELDAITEKAKKVGLETKFTATEAAEAFTYMGMAGWDSDQMLAGIDGVINLAAAAGEELGTVSDIITDDLTAFGMSASDAGHFADVLAAASTSANTTVSLMGDTFRYAGTMAGSLGYSIEDMSLAVGLMANSSIKGTQAGTSLNSIMTRLAVDTDGAREKIKSLGIDFYDAEGNANSFRSVMDGLREVTKGWSDDEKSELANKVAGLEAQKGLLAILNASEADYNKLANSIDNADGSAKRMSETMLDNLKGSMTLLQSATQGTLMSLGERLAPYVRTAVDWAADNMQYVEQFIGQVMDRVDLYINDAKTKIAAFTQTDDWINGDMFDKVKIAWDSLIGDPISEWWNSKGQAAFSKITGGIGKALGAGMKVGLMALLGIDVSSVGAEGTSLGAAFVKGFSESFDLGEVLTNAIKSHPILSALVGMKAGSSLLGAGKSLVSGGASLFGGLMTVGKGLISAFGGYRQGGIKGVLSNLKTIFSGSKGGLAEDALSSVSTMTVTASVVNLNGSTGATSARQAYYQNRRARSTAQNAETAAQGAAAAAPVGKYVVKDSTGNVIGNTNSILQAGLARVGTFLGTGARTVGGASLAGGGAILGGLTAAGTLISGAADLYKGAKSDNKDEKTGYYLSAGTKAAGVAAGAAIGSKVGTAVGGIFGSGIGAVPGALIGAGVGGLVGLVGGNAIQKHYAKKQTDDEAVKAAIDEEDNEAYSAALNAARIKSLNSSFGDLKLSLSEIEEAAQNIAFGKKAKELTAYSDAANSAESSLSGLSETQKDIGKAEWKISTGITLDEASYSDLESELNNLISYGKSYLTDSQFEFHTGVKLLLGEDGENYQAYDGVNYMYQKMQNQLTENQKGLQEAYSKAMEDGTIDTGEWSGIQKYIDEQNSITQRISEAQTNAKNEIAKSKFLGSDLSYDSFEEMRSALQTNAESGIETIQGALESSIANLNMSKMSGEINGEMYDQMVSALYEGANGNIRQIRSNIKDFELGAVVDAYGEQLDGVLPNLQGTTEDKLGQWLEGINIQDKSTEAIMNLLGLNNKDLSKEVQEAIAGLLQGVQSDMSIGGLFSTGNKRYDTSLLDFMGMTDLAAEGSSVVDSLDLDVDAIYERIRSNETAAEAASTSASSLADKTQAVYNTMREAKQNIASLSELSWTGLDFDLSQENLSFLENTDIAALTPEELCGKLGVTDSLSEETQSLIQQKLRGVKINLSELGILDIGGEGEGNGAFAEQISNAVQSGFGDGNVDLSTFGNGVGTSAGNAVQNGISNADSGIESAATTLDTNIKTQLGKDVSITKNITVDYNIHTSGLPNLDSGLTGGSSGSGGSDGGSGGGSGGTTYEASGGFVSNATRAIVGEAGPEAIIPLSAGRRDRGIDLWTKAGERLGVKMFADGGIVGGGSDDFDDSIPVLTANNDSSVNITVGANPTITVNSGNNAESIMQVLKANIENITDDVLDQVAEALTGIFANRPREA